MDAISVDVGDGFIHIQETEVCEAEFVFDNILKAAEHIITFEHGRFLVTREQYSGTIAEKMIVFDTRSQKTYSQIVHDNSSGRICVPWPLVG